MDTPAPLPQSRRRRVAAWLYREALPLLLMLALLVVARSSFANHYHVPSGSMQPTLEPGDRVVVDMSAYGLRVPFTRHVLVGRGRPQRGEVVMLHDENNEHACTGCTACELACPNGTIKIITKFDISPEGKKKKAVDTFIYHLELCTMCNLCVEACPTGAISMANTFEHSVFDRSTLTKQLNKPGSKIRAGVE